MLNKRGSVIIKFDFSPEQTVGEITKIVGFTKAKYLIPIIDFMDLEANPRSSKTGAVTDAIQESIETDPAVFPFKTKGILLASSRYERLERGRIKIIPDNPEIEGILDGGHNTLAIGLYILRKAMEHSGTVFPRGTKTWDDFKLLWVTEFPQFEYSEEEDRLVAMHHPFTAPMDEDIPLLDTDPAKVRAKAYDIILNGCELGGGSIRIHDPELQTKMFEALGFTEARAKEQFGHLITAFSYGAPPHGGLAYGLDRLCMLLAGLDSIRDVIAFPKVQNASALMMSCPDVVDDKQLDDLSIAGTRMEKEPEA